MKPLDREYIISQSEFDPFRNLTSKLTGMIVSFSNCLKISEDKKVQYKFGEEPEAVYEVNSNGRSLSNIEPKFKTLNLI